MHEKEDYTKLSLSRRFKIGDVILYDISGQQYGEDGNIHTSIKPYTRTGIMLISGFDYDSDIAARCSIGRSAIGLKSDRVYSNFAPAGENYRFAERHHIKKFIRDIENSRYSKLYEKELKILREKYETGRIID